MGRFPALIPFTVSKTTPQADSATLYLVVRLRFSRVLEIGHLRHRVVSLAEGAGLTKISLDIPEVFL
jgi:hypothetical protein